MKYFVLLTAVLIMLLQSAAYAIDTEKPLSDPALQARYENLTHQFRCLVCQNESIANSNASLAADLRAQVRGMLKAGKTDQQIKQYLVNRYGDFVLYDPPVQPRTWLLWFGPVLLLVLAVLVAGFSLRRKLVQARTESTDSTPDKQDL